MSVDGPVKIGVTSNLKHRLTDLQVACPYEVVMERAIKTDHKQIAFWFERALHHELRDYRVRGEWYEDTPEVWAIFRKYQDDGFAAASEQDVDPRLSDQQEANADVDPRFSDQQ